MITLNDLEAIGSAPEDYCDVLTVTELAKEICRLRLVLCKVHRALPTGFADLRSFIRKDLYGGDDSQAVFAALLNQAGDLDDGASDNQE